MGHSAAVLAPRRMGLQGLTSRRTSVSSLVGSGFFSRPRLKHSQRG